MKEKVFVKYPSLRNINGVQFSKMSNEDLERESIATEKLHGTNASLVVFKDGEVRLGTRKQFVEFDGGSSTHGTFIDYVDIDYFKEIGLKLIAERGFEQVSFFGEFFGKGIFNMDYIQVKEDRKEFRVFDIIGFNGFVEKQYTDGIVELKQFTKLNNDFVRSLLDLDYLVPYVTRGGLVDVIKELDLDAPSQFGGEIEGYVIKPVEEITYFSDESYALKGIKHKTKRFNEVVRKNKPVDKTPRYLRGLEGSMLSLVYDMRDYINEARLENVLSHGGLETTNENILPISKALQEDVLKEFEYDKDTYSEKEVIQANKRLTPVFIAEVKKLIEKRLKGELDSL